MSSECRTRLITDAPADEDAFGSHQKIASALADLVLTEPGGKAIGLEGGWGSGKSTVVNLLRKAVESDPDLRFVVFDAWSHEGDPLRRSFIETLIKSLDVAGWIDHNFWNEKKEFLTKRKKTSETTTSPRLTSFAKWLIITTLLVPIGYALFSSSLNNTVHLIPDIDLPIAWRFLIGLLISLAPLFLLLANKIFGSNEETWAILIKGSTTNTKSEAIETSDPTSIEFQTLFVELMTAALDTNFSSRRVVLVVDNLDRVTPKDALSIWASLRTFLQLNESNSLSWFNRFWIVVPYDPNGLGRLWNDDDGIKDLASSFIGKTFQLRLSVPPILVSNWRAYLNNWLVEAFPDHDSSEFHVIYRLYSWHLKETKYKPTPRNIKLFINDIGGIHRQWHHEIPLSDIAYYVLLGIERNDVTTKLLNHDVPHKEVIDLLSKEIADNLAALAFNTTVPEARQLLLHDPLTNTLEQGNAEALNMQSSTPGLWETLESIDFSQWSEIESSKLAKAALCLYNSNIVGNDKCPMKVQTLTNLRNAVILVSKWRPLSIDLGQGLSAICRLCPDQPVVQHILTTLSSIEPSEKKETFPEDWVVTIVSVLTTLDDLGRFPRADDRIPLLEPADMTLQTCHCMARFNLNDHILSAFKSNVSQDEVNDVICTTISNETDLNDLVEAVPVIRKLSVITDWKAIITTTKTKLETIEPLASSTIDPLLSLLSNLRLEDNDAVTAISSLATSGYLLHHLHTVLPKGKGTNIHTAAQLLILYLEFDPNISSPPGTGNSAAGHRIATQLVVEPTDEFASAIIGYIAGHNEATLLYDLVGNNEALKPLVLKCLRFAATTSDFSLFFPPEAVVENWDLVSEVPTETKLESFATLLREKTQLVSFLAKNDFVSNRGSLYALMISNGAGAELEQFCITGLKGIAGRSWQNELETESNLAELLVELNSANVEFTLGHEFQDALIWHARETAAGRIEPSYLNPSHWQQILSHLHEDSRKVFRRDLLSDAALSNGQLSEAFFNFYGQELAHIEVLSERNAIPGLFTSIIKSGNISGYQWMISFLRSNIGFFTSHPDISAVEDFKRRVQELVESPPDSDTASIRDLRQELADILGIHLGDLESPQTDE